MHHTWVTEDAGCAGWIETECITPGLPRETECITPGLPMETECITPELPRETECITPGLPRIILYLYPFKVLPRICWEIIHFLLCNEQTWVGLQWMWHFLAILSYFYTCICSFMQQDNFFEIIPLFWLSSGTNFASSVASLASSLSIQSKNYLSCLQVLVFRCPFDFYFQIGFFQVRSESSYVSCSPFMKWEEVDHTKV